MHLRLNAIHIHICISQIRQCRLALRYRQYRGDNIICRARDIITIGNTVGDARLIDMSDDVCQDNSCHYVYRSNGLVTFNRVVAYCSLPRNDIDPCDKIFYSKQTGFAVRCFHMRKYIYVSKERKSRVIKQLAQPVEYARERSSRYGRIFPEGRNRAIDFSRGTRFRRSILGAILNAEPAATKRSPKRLALSIIAYIRNTRKFNTRSYRVLMNSYYKFPGRIEHLKPNNFLIAYPCP